MKLPRRWLYSGAILLAVSLPALSGKVVLPPDRVYDASVGREQAVTFRHGTHVGPPEGACVACHPEPFRMLHPTRAASHEEMDAGRSCGRCHDGARAFATTDEKSCATCHRGTAGEAGAAGKDVTFRSSQGSPGPVLFGHAAHAATRCATCHDQAFAMSAGGTKLDSPLDLHGKCGTCHDGAKSFGVQDSDSCARCHAGEGARS